MTPLLPQQHKTMYDGYYWYNDLKFWQKLFVIVSYNCNKFIELTHSDVVVSNISVRISSLFRRRPDERGRLRHALLITGRLCTSQSKPRIGDLEGRMFRGARRSLKILREKSPNLSRVRRNYVHANGRSHFRGMPDLHLHFGEKS